MVPGKLLTSVSAAEHRNPRLDFATGFDAVMVLSFGGPDKPADVRPFLENVTRGRGVPAERLDAVAEHYHHFGGISPINAQGRAIIAQTEQALAAAGIDLPVHFGNRNWHPFLEDTLIELTRAGHRRILVFPTSPWGGYSGCRQYDEDIARALAAVSAAGLLPPLVRKLPHYWSHPNFITAQADAIRAVHTPGARVVFTAHSVPTARDPIRDGDSYSAQVHAAAALVFDGLRATSASRHWAMTAEYDVVWQSRSGPPSTPWLEPDICDHLRSLLSGASVVVCPIGFVSDHMEVIWDLDNEAKDLAAELGIEYVRAATASTHPLFAELVVDLVRAELARDGAAENASARALPGRSDGGAPCAVGCCR